MLGLDIAYWCTKFDYSSFGCSRDMVGAHPNVNGSRDLTKFLSKMIVIHELGLATINLPTKSEVSISAHHKFMKKDTKFGKSDGMG